MTNFHAGLTILGVLLATVSQLLLKSSANKKYDNKLKEYLNLRVVSAYGLFALSAALTMYVLRYLDLSVVSILQSMGYVFVPLASYFILKERISKLQIIGILVILAGIFVFNLT